MAQRAVGSEALPQPTLSETGLALSQCKNFHLLESVVMRTIAVNSFRCCVEHSEASLVAAGITTDWRSP
jgi:hypothetical protein